MSKMIDRFPYKKILYLNWYEAAIGHLLLFKYYVDKYSQNVYFLISEQGILLKASSNEYLRKAQEEINKFFTAKIQELELSGSADFYNNLMDYIKQQTQKLKDARDCPYINLVYSEKLRNSCLAMKKHGYLKPYENWQCHERQRKGFCFLIVRPEHRWKEIATTIYEYVRKRYASHSKNQNQMNWSVKICYQKFIWFYLKQSFKNFKKSLEIKDNKTDKLLTIVIKHEIPELNDLEKQIQSLTFSYRPRRPHILDINSENKIIVLSTLDIERITELVYHEFGLTSFAKQLRRKMSGFLVISVDMSDNIEDIQQPDMSEKRIFNLKEKEDLTCLNNKKFTLFMNRLGRRHSIISFQDSRFLQLKIEKPIRENYEKILKIKLPCLPRYCYWHENEKNYFLVRSYISDKFQSVFQKSKIYDQVFLLYSLLSVVEELHQKNVIIGQALIDGVFIDEKRVIIEPDQYGSKDEDLEKLVGLANTYIDLMKQADIKRQLKALMSDGQQNNPFAILQTLQQYIDDNR